VPTVTLTDISLRSLKPVPGKRITYLDRSLKGFGVMLTPAGHASFVLTYGPDRKRIKLGDVGVVSLKSARDAARNALAGHQLGLGEKETRGPTYEKALAEFIANSEKRNKPRTTRDYRRLLTRHFTAWNKRTLDELSPQEVQRRVDRIEADAERRHAYDALKVFSNWAVRRHYTDRPLTARMDAPLKGGARDRILTDDELKAVWHACDGADHFSRIIRLCILTGQRRSEIGSLRAEYIRDGSISFPSELIKNGREHVFPIGPMTQALLAPLPSSGYLFPARKTWRSRGTVYNAWNKDKPRLDKRSGVSGWVIHDCRRTFSSSWARLGIPIEVTEKYINHVSGKHSGVQAIYNRFDYLQPMRDAVERYEKWLYDLIATG
jgi:integrase